jgi:hypothetical protein
VILMLLSTGFGLTGAWYWLITSRVDTVPPWAKAGGIEPVVAEMSTLRLP